MTSCLLIALPQFINNSEGFTSFHFPVCVCQYFQLCSESISKSYKSFSSFAMHSTLLNTHNRFLCILRENLFLTNGNPRTLLQLQGEKPIMISHFNVIRVNLALLVWKIKFFQELNFCVSHVGFVFHIQFS